jgi:low temperature requirement protein LtrA
MATPREARQERWSRVQELRRLLWQPPRPHGEQPQERVVGPLELFYDLVVVVLVAQAAHRLAGHLGWDGVGEFATVFALVWIAWLNGSLHHDLHGHDDARSRTIFLLQILALAPMGAYIGQAGGARSRPFAIAAATLFLLLAGIWFQANQGDGPEYRRASRLFIGGTVVTAVVLAVSAAVPFGARMPIWAALAVLYLAGFATMIVTASPLEARALLVTDALAERFGLLVIIVLGETVTGVVTGLAAEPTSSLTLIVALVGIVVGFGSWWTYFDFAGYRQPRAGQASTVQWMLAHLPITAAIATMGASMVSLVEHAHDSRTPVATAWVLSAGAAGVLCWTTVVAGSLPVWREKRMIYRPLTALCVVMAAVALGLAALRPAPLLLGLALVVVFSVPWGFAVARRLAVPDEPAGRATPPHRSAP